ncbi:hypothetical protein NL676_015895 [Syzygium grande]|nr:hypothetical protein NL676_015895 [Syzygium grande]
MEHHRTCDFRHARPEPQPLLDDASMPSHQTPRPLAQSAMCTVSYSRKPPALVPLSIFAWALHRLGVGEKREERSIT